jgi:hypothetical protein
MRKTTLTLLAFGACAMSAATAAPMAAAASAGTPDTCIHMNGGDWNACDVGNAGRGDVPYVPVLRPHSVALCIQRNHGDAIACRVGAVNGFYPR